MLYNVRIISSNKTQKFLRSQSVQNIVQSLTPALKRDDVFNIRHHLHAVLKPRARVTRSGKREAWVNNQGIFTSTIMKLLIKAVNCFHG